MFSECEKVSVSNGLLCYIWMQNIPHIITECKTQ